MTDEQPSAQTTPQAVAPTQEPVAEAVAEPVLEPVAELIPESAPDVPQEPMIAQTVPTQETELPYASKLVGIDQLRAGQTVRLHERIKDVSPKGEVRERIQVFEGMILALGGKGISRTITVYKVSDGVGVEKIYPINSPVVAKIELVKTARVRQAKLGFLKHLKLGFKRKLKETYTELGMEKKKK